ncbi:MAG: thiamine phosphate synthase [Magnetococcus sp. DMHC-6]
MDQNRLTLPRFMLITDRHVCPNLEDGVAAGVAGGADHVLLREKDLSTAELLVLAQRIHPRIQQEGGRLLIHTNLTVAWAVGAIGVHLPSVGGPSTWEVRKKMGPELLLGRSCHTVEQAQQALTEGADYVTISPVFPTRSHLESVALGLDRFAWMCQHIPGTVLGLGGIQADNAASVLAAGAKGVACIRGVLDAQDPKSAAKKMVSAFGKK